MAPHENILISPLVERLFLYPMCSKQKDAQNIYSLQSASTFCFSSAEIYQLNEVIAIAKLFNIDFKWINMPVGSESLIHIIIALDEEHVTWLF